MCVPSYPLSLSYSENLPPQHIGARHADGNVLHTQKTCSKQTNRENILLRLLDPLLSHVYILPLSVFLEKFIPSVSNVAIDEITTSSGILTWDMEDFGSSFEEVRDYSVLLHNKNNQEERMYTSNGRLELAHIYVKLIICK